MTSVQQQVTKQESAHSEASRFFEDLWSRGDPWALETSPYEDHRYQRLLETLADRHYERVLEIGCGAGAFTRRLATRATSICALDVSETAINRARATPCAASAAIDYRVADVMRYDIASDGPFDLVIMTETIYYLGWLYSFFDVGWLAHQLFAATREGGHLLLSNTLSAAADYLMRPWLIRTYHDLFANTGFHPEMEDVYADIKDDTEFEILTSRFCKLQVFSR
jgi:2-polyprenyl-3-methyl-5-hydroxy-6-metoxy-1,4-benzoquinol methylase